MNRRCPPGKVWMLRTSLRPGAGSGLREMLGPPPRPKGVCERAEDQIFGARLQNRKVELSKITR